MKEKEKKFGYFLKILLLMVAVFIGLALYMAKILEENKVNIQKRIDDKIIVKTTPIDHPPLNTRNEVIELDSNISEDDNETRKIPEGAEYITPEELLKREEANVSKNIPLEEIYDDSTIIPQDEIANYRDAVTVPMNEGEGIAEYIPSSSLGTPIRQNQNLDDENFPFLGTKIENQTVSPF